MVTPLVKWQSRPPDPMNTHESDVGSISDQLRRRWSSMESTLKPGIVLAW